MPGAQGRPGRSGGCVRSAGESIRKRKRGRWGVSSPRREAASSAIRKGMKGILWFAVIALAIVAAGAIIATLPVPPGPPPEPPIGNPSLGTRPGGAGRGTPLSASGGNALALVAQGCFWGVEERFRRVPGVVATAVGYAGGRTDHPTYAQVSSGSTGHVEAVLVEFDPRQVGFERLLEVFWETHDPTSGDRQGPDRGTQYRSAIFTFGDEQRRAALLSRERQQERLAEPITTEISPAGRFWLAEDEHQQWDEKHHARSCPAPERPRPRQAAAGEGSGGLPPENRAARR